MSLVKVSSRCLCAWMTDSDWLLTSLKSSLCLFFLSVTSVNQRQLLVKAMEFLCAWVKIYDFPPRCEVSLFYSMHFASNNRNMCKIMTMFCKSKTRFVGPSNTCFLCPCPAVIEQWCLIMSRNFSFISLSRIWMTTTVLNSSSLR